MLLFSLLGNHFHKRSLTSTCVSTKSHRCLIRFHESIHFIEGIYLLSIRLERSFDCSTISKCKVLRYGFPTMFFFRFNVINKIIVSRLLLNERNLIIQLFFRQGINKVFSITFLHRGNIIVYYILTITIKFWSIQSNISINNY